MLADGQRMWDKPLDRLVHWWRTERSWWHLATALLIPLFVLVCLRNAWVVDESYITFRTAENLLNGYGLTWNTGERVQAYTCPLWMFVLAGAALFTSEFYYTVIAVSLACTLGVLVLGQRLFSVKSTGSASQARWKMPLLVVLLCGSKAFIDFGTSGLENPLTYLLCAAFVLHFVRVTQDTKPPSNRALFWLVFLASLSAVNRLDTALLYAPAILYCGVKNARRLRFRLLAIAALGALPLVLWLTFSLFYYGYPFPNTYYAKLAASGASSKDLLVLGINTFANSFRWDLLTHATIVFALALAAIRRRIPSLMILTGVVLYLLYVLTNAASATHMSGRFFSVPFVMAALVAVRLLDFPKVAGVVAAAVLVYTGVSDRASVKFGTDYYAKDFEAESVIDTKLAVYKEGAALLNYDSETKLPNHAWFKAGLQFRKSKKRVEVYYTPGYYAYAAGPDKWVIDGMGLCDPLLARIPGKRHPNMKGGHFLRDLPKGYRKTVTTHENHIADPSLREYYEIVINITQAPLFSAGRFKHIVHMNLGRYDHLIDEYMSRKKGAALVLSRSCRDHRRRGSSQVALRVWLSRDAPIRPYNDFNDPNLSSSDIGSSLRKRDCQ